MAAVWIVDCTITCVPVSHLTLSSRHVVKCGALYIQVQRVEKGGMVGVWWAYGSVSRHRTPHITIPEGGTSLTPSLSLSVSVFLLMNPFIDIGLIHAPWLSVGLAMMVVAVFRIGTGCAVGAARRWC